MRLLSCESCEYILPENEVTDEVRHVHSTCGEFVPTSVILTKDVRCIHLPFPVPKGTKVTDISFLRKDGDATICQGWSYLKFGDREEMLTLVVFDFDHGGYLR